MYNWPQALLGGALIGFAAVLAMATVGRIAGISGIASGMLYGGDDRAWRASFVFGLLSAAPLYALLNGGSGLGLPQAGAVTMLIAGVFVGLGTGLSAGCTSGHGVCGIARFSPRSLAATAIFMAAAIFTVGMIRHVLVVQP